MAYRKCSNPNGGWYVAWEDEAGFVRQPPSYAMPSMSRAAADREVKLLNALADDDDNDEEQKRWH